MGEVVQDAVERVRLVELDIGIAVTVLHADDDLLAALDIGQHRHRGAVAGHALVGPARVPLLGLEKLVVEVKVVDPAGNQLPAPDSHIEQQAVQGLGRVEAVFIAAVARVDRVGGGQLREHPKHRVGAAQAAVGAITHALPDVVDVLGAVAAAEEVAHHRAHNLAVSVPGRLAAATKILIYRALDGLKLMGLNCLVTK